MLEKKSEKRGEMKRRGVTFGCMVPPKPPVELNTTVDKVLREINAIVLLLSVKDAVQETLVMVAHLRESQPPKLAFVLARLLLYNERDLFDG